MPESLLGVTVVETSVAGPLLEVVPGNVAGQQSLLEEQGGSAWHLGLCWIMEITSVDDLHSAAHLDCTEWTQEAVAFLQVRKLLVSSYLQ
ncbi:hypothetical protein XENOCAPTIV_000362 [Xenoophorus captivus]|uniref:MHC class I antigen n=1 Tax=Xenoophorus captivus TaxID=1517983 RepID=A0ABV0QCK8_9TELE